jgi:endonuclease/exonuclease/phosphatase family metal-dependent hydrolase
MAITLLGPGTRRRRTRRHATRRRRPEPRFAPSPADGPALRLLTLNIAHARREAQHQALLAPPALKHNLAAIASVLAREAPDVVALQEADGPSAWSGDFDHVATLAELARLPHAFRGEHNPFSFGRFDLSSGTALLSRYPLAGARSRAFLESWRDTKGFVAATVAPEALGGAGVDVVSIHLDFLAERVRRRQVEQLVETFRRRERPLVVMGDFNCEWSERRRSLALLRRELELRPPAEPAHATFPSWRPLVRLDWILVSAELAFASYETLPDRLSDHLGVVAAVRLRDSASASEGGAERDELPLASGFGWRRRVRRARA